MNIKLTPILLLATLITLSGCVSEFHADIPFSDENILVVEGDVIANSEVDIILSKTFSLETNTLPEGFNNIQAVIHLVGNDGYKSPAATYMGDGIHRLAVGELLDNVSYSIEIEYDGEKYVSDPASPLTTPEIDNLDWRQASNASDVSIRVSTHSEEPGFSYYMWDYIEDWEFTSAFMVYDFYDPERGVMERMNWAPVYYCWRNRRGKEILLGSTESLAENKILNQQLRLYECLDERFDYLYSIRLRQMALSKRAYEYFQNRAKMSDDMGGLFTPQPSELVGNVVCITDKSRKVIGYINILKNVTETQLYIKGSEITKKPFVKCRSLTKEEAEKMMAESKIGPHEFYTMGYWPLDGSFIYEVNSWANASCVDCTRKGGSKNKPDFWPNDHR